MKEILKKILKIFPRIFVASIMWLGVVGIIVYVDPSQVRDVIVPGIYLPLVASVGVALWYTLLLVTKSLKYASTLTTLLLITMVTIILQWMNIMIAVALVGMIVSLGLTFARES